MPDHATWTEATYLEAIDSAGERGSFRRLRLDLVNLLIRHQAVATNGDFMRALMHGLEEMVRQVPADDEAEVRAALARAIRDGVWRLPRAGEPQHG